MATRNLLFLYAHTNLLYYYLYYYLYCYCWFSQHRRRLSMATRNLLFLYAHTNLAATHFTCFTGTQVQIPPHALDVDPQALDGHPL
jgi:hypothetical protein